MNNFMVGEKVRVKSFTKRPIGWTSLMEKYAGTIQTVSFLLTSGYVMIDGWVFCESEIRKLNFIERIFVR